MPVLALSLKLPSVPVVAVHPAFSSFTTAPDIGVEPVSVTTPLIFAKQIETPNKPVSTALIGTIKFPFVFTKISPVYRQVGAPVGFAPFTLRSGAQDDKSSKPK
jgi:hypothetical protein